MRQADDSGGRARDRQPEAVAPGEATIEVVELAKAGDAAAIERLMAKCLPLLTRWAHNRLPASSRDMIDTQDIVQETLVNAFRRLPSFRWEREGALYAYLRQALHNRLCDEHRRHARKPVRAELTGLEPNREKSPLDELLDGERRDRYEAALMRLRPIYREAIVGRIELQLSYEELAAALGKDNANTARVTLMRAVQRLVREMEREK